MKNLRLLWSLPLIAALAACGGRGSSAPQPTGLTVDPLDTQLRVNWTSQPGVTYYLFCAPNASAIDSHTPSATHSGWIERVNVTPPYIVSGLTNGTPYACTVNGRVSEGPGGVDAVPQVGTPRLAGGASSWISGTTPAWTTMSVNSMAYGMPTGQGLTTDQFVAVGAAGKIAVSTSLDVDAQITWTTPSQPLTDVTGALNAVAFHAGGNRFVAVGAEGKVAYTTTNAYTWASSSMTVATGVSANAVASNGSRLVAVGSSGLIRLSDDSGVTWTTTNATVPSVYTNSTFRSVVYAPLANGGATSPYWMAVGDAGVVLKSSDNGVNWVAVTVPTSANLKGLAVLPVYAISGSTVTTTYILAAVAENGDVVISSNDGASWQRPTSISPTPAAFVAVAAGRGQFMAVDTNGWAFTSTDGLSWVGVASGVLSTPPAALVRFIPSVTSISSGWMVFDAAGNQRLAR